MISMEKPGLVPPTPSFDVASDAIIGRRSEQQDFAYVGAARLAGGRSGAILLVADGMGGAVGGGVASRTAVEAFMASFDDAPAILLEQRLRNALQAANQAIARRVQENRKLKGMGCTLVAAVTDGADVTWISVGDSLLITVNPAGIKRLNEDHSLAPILDQAASRGEMTRHDAANSPDRNALRSALTGGNLTLVDVGTTTLKAGARLIVASDGILSLPGEAMRRLSSEAGSARALVASVLAEVTATMAPDQDNTTVAAFIAQGYVQTAAAMRLPISRRAKIALGVAIAVLIAAISALAFVSLPPPKPAKTAGPVPASPVPSDNVLPPDQVPLADSQEQIHPASPRPHPKEDHGHAPHADAPPPHAPARDGGRPHDDGRVSKDPPGDSNGRVLKPYKPGAGEANAAPGGAGLPAVERPAQEVPNSNAVPSENRPAPSRQQKGPE